MNIRHETPEFMVVDDFLSPDAAEQMWRWFQYAPFFSNDARGQYGAWRLDDGRVLRGPDIYYGDIAGRVADVKRGSFAYPTRTAIDLLVAAFVAAEPLVAKLIGKQGPDWRTMALAPRLYERGSSLYWHRDSPSVVTGSSTYYGHPEWNIQWGGELFIADPSSRSIPEDYGPTFMGPKEVMGKGLVQLSSHLDNREANSTLMEAGVGSFVAPKPNRLVVMKTGNPHMINKVQPAAGDHVRASVTMFFIRPGQEGTHEKR